MGDSKGSAKSGNTGGKSEKAAVDKSVGKLKSLKTDEDKRFDDLFAKDNAFEKATGKSFEEIQRAGAASNYQKFGREREERQSQKDLSQLTQEAALPGQKGKYYYDKVFEMEDAIRANPNLTNFQKVTQIDKLRTQIGLGSGRFQANKNYGLDERVAGAGMSALQEATKRTPITETDFANLSPDQQQKAAMLMSRYKAPVVLTRDGQVQSTGGFKDVFSDISKGLGAFGKKAISGDIGLTGALKNMFAGDQGPVEPIDYLQSDYTDYFANPRYLDTEYNYSPTGDYLGIAGTPTGMELENMFLAQNMGGGDVPVPETAEDTSEESTRVPFVGGYSGTPATIVYPSGTGGNLVSYEDIINQIT
tara:strand:- start:2478 stop:3563 length:1086 start_codon:yes stop_codon:yes gene_type:complete